MAEERWFVKKPCQHCPFRADVRPFLRVERAEELAYSTQNRYSDFTCHKTLGDGDDGELIVTAESLTCAGFLSMQVNEAGIAAPEGFEPSDNVYSEAYDMAQAYEEEANGDWCPPFWLKKAG